MPFTLVVFLELPKRTVCAYYTQGGNLTGVDSHVQGNGSGLALREAGAGKTIWYLHDEVSIGPGPVAEALAKEFRVISPIHPGFGPAARPDWVRNTEDIAELYLDLFTEESEEPVCLVGSSVGAWIAVELALLMGERVGQLSLIGPIGLHVQDHPPADHWFQTDDDRDAILFHDRANKPVVEMEEFMTNEAMFARLGWNPRLSSNRLAPRLSRLRPTVTILWGENDALIPREQLTAWERQLPQASTIMVEGAGHYPVYEQPETVVARLSEHLARDTGSLRLKGLPK